jgi:antitoxin (DNA-binding transcriptional repressor) of toxin-antitoxin stability system
MSRRRTVKGAEEARASLPELLDEAERGRSTLITRHGRAIAELSPVGRTPAQQRSLLPLQGSGEKLWGDLANGSLADLRDEWTR